MISLITAIDKKGGIGKDDKIPWKCPEDMRFFKCMTKRKICLAGKSTYESLPDAAKKDRIWLRFTNTPKTEFESIICGSIFSKIYLSVPENIIEAWDNPFNSIELMLCGGAKIYKEFLDRDWVDRLYITRIPGGYDCDTFFPEYDEEKFKFSYRIFLDSKPLEDYLYVDVYDRK